VRLLPTNVPGVGGLLSGGVSVVSSSFLQDAINTSAKSTMETEIARSERRCGKVKASDMIFY
jgi:hypothetical protein